MYEHTTVAFASYVFRVDSVWVSHIQKLTLFFNTDIGIKMFSVIYQGHTILFEFNMILATNLQKKMPEDIAKTAQTVSIIVYLAPGLLVYIEILGPQE